MSDDIRTDLEFVDIYATTNSAEATFIKDMFDAEGITHLLNDQKMSAFPTGNAEIQIEVDSKDVTRAVALLKQAIEDDAITDEGEFV
jgi:hypothetical protein